MGGVDLGHVGHADFPQDRREDRAESLRGVLRLPQIHHAETARSLSGGVDQESLDGPVGRGPQRYDPVSGKYGPVVINMIRLAGLATVVLIAAAMFVMSRRRARALRVIHGASASASASVSGSPR